MSALSILGVGLGVLAALVLITAQNRYIKVLEEGRDLRDDMLKKRQEKIEALQARFGILSKFSCCGCGHLIGRHTDPASADGFGCLDCDCQAVHNLIDKL